MNDHVIFDDREDNRLHTLYSRFGVNSCNPANDQK